MSAVRETESTFQDAVIEFAVLAGWRVNHQRPARTSRGWRTAIQGDAGFPDLVLLKDRSCIVAELKGARGRVSVEQQAWLQRFRRAGIEVHIWRPKDWDEIVERLKR